MGRRLAAAALMITLCLGLSSCLGAKNDEDASKKVAQYYSSLGSMTATVRVYADYGDRTQEYLMSYEYTAPDGNTVTLIEPEEIAGIKAALSEDGVTLEFDGVILETGHLRGTGLTPVECLPALMSAWSGGYISEYGSEKVGGNDCALLTYLLSQGGVSLEVRTYFEKNTLLPHMAELFSGGERILTCSFEDVNPG